MPLYIIEDNITSLACDAIVNAANSSLLGGGGVDGAIHRAAGRGLYEECRTLGGCATGDAKLTGAYNLPSKYVIHTVGPRWHGGSYGEERLLRSCYARSLELAAEKGCETVAFPLISSGAYGYPKDAALRVAVEEISAFLLKNEMTVYIVVFDRGSYKINPALLAEVTDYVTDRCEEMHGAYAEEAPTELYSCAIDPELECADIPKPCFFTEADPKKIDGALYLIRRPIGESAKQTSIQITGKPSLEDMLANMDDSFAVTLLKLIDAKGKGDVECYKRANVSKQTWYKIMNDGNYRPSKSTVLAFAIALELSLAETRQLLATVGFALSRSSKTDIIIEYFIMNESYDIFLINETLFAFDLPCLGA